MARKTATEFNRSLVIALAAAFVVIAVVAIIVYTPAARTGQFHGAEAVVSVSLNNNDYYDFENQEKTQTDADIKVEFTNANTHLVYLQNSAQSSDSKSAATDCFGSSFGSNTPQISKGASGWPAERYFCIKTSQGDYYLIKYDATDSGPDSISFVQQGICGDGIMQAMNTQGVEERCDGDAGLEGGTICTDTCTIKETNCFNIGDDDGDSKTDCKDSDCDVESQPVAQGTVSCSGGDYYYMCDNNFDNCDGDVRTGCDTDLKLAGTCGSCDTTCTTDQTCQQQTGGAYACVSAGANHNPTITSTAITDAAVNQPYTYTVTATDEDGDTLTYGLSQSPTGMAIDASSGIISWRPTQTQTGEFDVTAGVSDGRGGTATQSFKITIQSIQDCMATTTWPTAFDINPKEGSTGQITPTIASGSLSGSDCPGKKITVHTDSDCTSAVITNCDIGGQSTCDPSPFAMPSATTTYYACLKYGTVRLISNGKTFTAPPTVIATHMIQGTVATITVNANNQQATNDESQINEITILVDNTLVKTCTVSPEAPAATCEYSGTYSASSTHTYYGKAKNNANLEGQSSPQGSFTIPADANLPSITNIQATQPLNPGVATTVSWQAANVNHFEVSYTTDTTKECKEQDVDADGSVCGGGASGWNCVRQHTDASGTPNAAATAGWTIPAGMVPTGADYKDVQIRIEGHKGTSDLHKVAVNACQTLRVTRQGTVAEVQTGQACTQSGQQMACYSSDRGTKDIGVCKGGVRSCYQNKTWSACVGEVIPTTELCDGLDNNCNFISDDALIGGQPVASGACNTPDKCGTNRADCTKIIDVQFGEPACLSNQNNVFSCGFACLNGFTECGGSCFRDNGNGGCANDVWVCSGGSELDPVASECMLKEPCAGLPAGTGQQCYTGPTGTENIGECNAGFRTCGADGFWTICSGQAWPDADVCDGRDNNCNGLIDDFSGRGEGSACPGAANCGPQKIDCNIVVAGKNVDAATCISNQCKVFSCTLGWQDKDGKAENGCETRLTGCIDPDKDGYGALNTDLSKCAKSKTVMDCDSKNSAINPGMNETCNGKDDDCDGLADEDVLETRTCGFGVCAGGEQTRTCEESAYTEWSECSTDYLKGTESATVCNALDDDCNGVLDDPFDFDKDGFPANVTACAASYATAGKSLDCNDKDKLTFPGANETCNGVDNDCNGVIDDFLGSEDPEETLCACSGMSASEVKLQKKEVEEINGIDDNCDGKLAPNEQDLDSDGFTPDQGDCDDKKEDVNPDADELCSTNYDDNCDGKANEGCTAAATRPAARNISILDLAFGTTPRPAPAAPTPLAPPEVSDELPLAPEAPTGEIPAEEPFVDEEFIPEAKKPNTTLLISIISLVAAALGGALWFVRAKMKANVSAEAEAFGIGGPEETGMEDVKGFVSSSMAQGHPASAVKGVLSEKGWQGGDIDQALEETAGDIEKLGGMAEEHGLAPDQEAGLKKYISNARASGFSDAQIKAALINGGWDAKTVGKYL